MVARIAQIEFSILSHGAFFRAPRVRVVKRQFSDRIKASCKARGTILRVSFSLNIKWFSFGILQVLDCMNVNAVLGLLQFCVFVKSIRLRKAINGHSCSSTTKLYSLLERDRAVKADSAGWNKEVV